MPSSERIRLLFWGYSMPDADYLAAQMFRRSFGGNVANEALHCINPDPQIVPRVKEKLGASVVHLYDGMEQYLVHSH